MYLVFARKYRPQRFEEVVGQAHIARTLQNAVRTGRVAHAYLFCGGRGIGKTSMARILAKALNCKDGPTAEPCGQCDSCRRIAIGEDLDVVEIDGASNRGIDEIRELRERAGYAPARSRFKVYYVDEVHMLTQPAFNALLKTLEEPPPHVKFIFSTTDPQQLPETVKSRCQRFDFRRISEADMIAHLRGICAREGLEVQKGALEMIARAARGSLRDALGVLDQVASLGSKQVRTEDLLLVLGAARTQSLTDIVDALAAGQTGQALKLLRDVLFSGVDLIDLVDQLSEYLRDLLMASYVQPEDGLLAGAAADAQTLVRQSGLFTAEQIVYMIQVLREAKLRARRDTTGCLALELAIIKLSRLRDLIVLEEALADRPTGPAPAAAPGKPATPSEPASAQQRIQSMMQKLQDRKAEPKGGSNGEVPDGVDPARFRQIHRSADDASLAEQVREDRSLLSAFAEGDKQVGLQPVRLRRGRKQPPQKPPAEMPPGETEQ